MRRIICIIVFITGLTMLIAMPRERMDFQKEIGIQAAQFKDSPNHVLYRANQQTRNYQVGDSHTFWRWNLAVMPPAWIQTPATCRAVGNASYVFVADSEWNNHITQANVDSIMVRLEQNTPNNPHMGAITMDVNLFGPIPNELDNDPKLIVFYSALGSFQGTSFDGYFSAYNQVTEAEAQQMNPAGHSNECEMIYMTCYPLSPVAPVRMSVLAHELEHMIHWGLDPDEESWLDEGCAELAMVKYGVPDPISGFNTNPDNNLASWNQATADYVKTMLFFTFLEEHYDYTDLINDLVANPTNGMASFLDQTAIDLPLISAREILRNWMVANYLDKPIGEDSLYVYRQLSLPTFTSTSVNLHPEMTNQTIQPYAADYLYFTLNQQQHNFTLHTSNSVFFSELVFNEQNQCTGMIDGGFGNEAHFNPIPDSAHHVVFVIANTEGQSVTYSYETGTVSNSDDASTPATLFSMEYPNPYYHKHSGLKIHLQSSGSQGIHGSLSLYDIRGRMLRQIDNLQASAHEIDVQMTDANHLCSGIYFLRFDSDGRTLTKKLMILK